ncbi:toxin-antitoxin system YwqK family antitoxin [Georgenia wangjunii]|uniref:toxin-antitoxin system YwqK family antitoxin n=1 Tax=Georgenia wangjunii TaxID=3117730 RepID=UPI002F26319D
MAHVAGPGSADEEHVQRHRDGTVWARGQTRDGEAHGYWEWFRRDGTTMRSGWFEAGEPVGEWTTYDKSGVVYKVTAKKPRTDGT